MGKPFGGPIRKPLNTQNAFVERNSLGIIGFKGAAPPQGVPFTYL